MSRSLSRREEVEGGKTNYFEKCGEGAGGLGRRLCAAIIVPAPMSASIR